MSTAASLSAVFDLLVERCLLSLPVKAGKGDRVSKQFHDEPNRGVLDEFIREPDVRCVYVYTEGSERIVVSLQADMKKKGVFLLKSKHVQDGLRVEDVRGEVCVCECSENVLQQLSLVAHEVFFPLLANPANRMGWSGPTAKEVLMRVSQFLSSVTIAVGQSKGQTLLPHPPPEAFEEEALQEKERVHLLESAVVAWSNKVEAVLSSDSGAILRSNAQAALQAEKEAAALKRSKTAAGGHTGSGVVAAGAGDKKGGGGGGGDDAAEAAKAEKAAEANVEKEKANLAAFPGPQFEVEFWHNKALDLASLQQQLASPKLLQVHSILLHFSSAYASQLGRLQADVRQCAVECCSNARFLRPLRPLFVQLTEELDFTRLEATFHPLFHTLLLIFQHSPCYNTSGRLSAVLQMLCNALVAQANKHVNGEAVFRLIEDENTAEAVTLIKQTIRTAERFKAIFQHYQRKAQALFTDPQLPTFRSWEVDAGAVFSRVDAYVERAGELLDFCRVVLEFSKLQKVFIGGTKGKELTAALWQVHADFAQHVAQFRRVDYDLLDISVSAFDADVYTYRAQVKELEKRLASSLIAAFNESATLTARFQLLDSFEGLLERPVIKDELDKKLSALLHMYSEEVKAVQETFHKSRHSPKIDTNMPPVAGALSWVRALRGRVEEPMDKLRYYVHFLSSTSSADAAAHGGGEGEREEMRELVRVQSALVQALAEYEQRALQEWSADIDSSSAAKLQQPLLRRDSNTGLLYVNFDGGLVKLLREVKYFLLLHIAVPTTALTIYDKAELYRQQISHLEHILSMYNEMVLTLHKVERPLVERELRSIDAVLQRGLSELNWQDGGVNSFINEAMEVVKQTHSTTRVMKDNLSSIRRAVSEFAAVPLVERKNKPLSPSDFEDNLRKLWQTRHTLLVEVGEQVNRWLEETRKAVGDPAAAVWSAYVDYVQDGVRDGLALAIVNSLRFLCDQLDPARTELAPLLEVKLGLYGNEVAFNAEDGPGGSGSHSSRGSVGGANADGGDRQALLIQQAALLAANPAIDLASSPATLTRRSRRDVWALVREWVDSLFDIGQLVSRQDGSSYVADLKRDPAIQRYLDLLNQHLDANSRQCEEVRAEYCKYDALWKTDRQADFHKFLAQAIAEAKQKTAEEEKKKAGKSSGGGEAQKGSGEGAGGGGGGGGEGGKGDDDKEEEEGDGLDVLPLERFEERILYYRDIAAELGEKRSPVDIGWLKVNASPIKVALQSWANRWVTTFTHFLYHDVTRKLHSLEQLMTEVNEGLTTEVVAGDSATLKRVLGYIHSIRSQEKSTMRVFQPLRDCVSLLKKYGKNLDELEMKMLSDAPMKWDSTVNQVYRVKERVNVLQNDEVDKIKERVCEFDVELRRVRKDYKENAPFSYDCAVQEAYDLMFEYHEALNALEERAAKLTDLEKVFELNVSKHRQIRKCRAENRLLKLVWDMTAVIKHQCEDWKKTKWQAIDTDELLAETKKLQKSLLQLPSEVQGWDVYAGLSGEVKNLLTVLPLVNLLHSPAMEDRHWRELKVATGKAFVKDESFCLSSVLELELHRFVVDVEYIVELANKESKISGQLKKIESQWLTLELQFGVATNGITSIKRPDDILVALEENMAALQGMSGQGKYVEHFIDEVVRWQKLLNHAETVLYDWLDVQGKWSSLEAIFLGSKDIRVQLPEDSQRFDDIDRSWKHLMANAQNTPNVIEATSTQQRGEALISMKQGLEHCEKSLFQYLETKRKAFPRFYFLSNAALLDILSSGHDPQAVQKHLGDCFPEHDTRVLTDSGFLFLHEIEERVERKETVLYACYDIAKKGLVYSSGDVVLKPNPAQWVDFTQAATRRLWDETSDAYGSTASAASKPANYVSLRTTPQHKMYVQLAHSDTGPARKRGGAAVPPHKMFAAELAPGFVCRCRDGTECCHGYPVYRMHTGAPAGIAYADVMSEYDTTELLAHRPPGERDSPVVRLGLRSADQLDAFLELYGYWVGDGTMQYDQRNKHPYAVLFKPKKQRDRPYVLDLLARLRLGHDEWTVDDGHADGCLKILITAAPWCLYFDEQYGTKYQDSQRWNREKAIAMLGNGPPSRQGDEPDEPGKPFDPDEEQPAKSCKWFWWWVLKRLDKRQLQLVIEGLRQADGVSARCKKQKAAGTAFSGLRRICTSSVSFRDALIQACLHAGYSAYFIINTRAGKVRGYNAVPTDYRIYKEAEMMQLLAANPKRRFEPVRPKYDNWVVKYTLSTEVKLAASDVRYDGKPLRPRQKRKTSGTCYVAEHGRFGLRNAPTQSKIADAIGMSMKTVSNYADKNKRTPSSWKIFTKAAYEESISSSKSSSSSGSASTAASAFTAATVPADEYAERDGRTWCVHVKHTDHLIVVQRAHRNAHGIVTKATRPLVTGNCFDNIQKLSFHTDSQGHTTKTATGMYSKEGDEYVQFAEPLDCVGPVEDWLGRLVVCMRVTLMDILSKAKFTADHWEIEKPRHRWLFDYPAQLALTASQIQWTEEVGSQFDAFADGNEQAMKEYASKVLATRLEQLIQLVLGDLSHCDRVKIMTLITVDVHNRDVVQRLIENKVQDSTAFAWQSQMRMKWKPDTKDCLIQVADASFNYSFEYIGPHINRAEQLHGPHSGDSLHRPSASWR